MNILLLSATPFEIVTLLDHLERDWISRGNGKYQKGSLTLHTLISGVGMVATAWHLGQYLSRTQPDLVINAGVAGAFDRRLQLGDVVQVVEEQFGDLGVEEADGRFTTMFELGLIGPDQLPFQGGLLKSDFSTEMDFLPKVKALTVNKVHGYDVSIDAILRKFPDAQTESMEGAAVFYCCASAGLPCLQIRSISNYVENRNRESWELALAIEKLNGTLIEMLEVLIG